MESVTRGIPAPRPPGALTENELIDPWDRSLPLASVLVLTYNHEHFFDDCMSGILGQRSRFPFEVIIRDDASTDATSRKALSYAMNWPRIVRVLQEEYRTWPDVTPMPTLIQESRGEMIFLCEGDDYWTDDNYLQTGMEKLSENREVSMYETSCVHIRDGMVVGASRPGYGETRCMALRRSCIDLDELTDITSRIVSGSLLLLQMAHESGEVLRSSQVTGVYRLHERGVAAVKRADDAVRWRVEQFSAALELREYCRRRGNEQSRKYWDMRLAKVCLETLDNRGSLLRAVIFTGKKFRRLALRKVKRLFRERL